MGGGGRGGGGRGGAPSPARGTSPYPSRLSEKTIQDADRNMHAPDAMSQKYGGGSPPSRYAGGGRQAGHQPGGRHAGGHHAGGHHAGGHQGRQPGGGGGGGGRPGQGGSVYPSRLSEKTIQDADRNMHAPDAMSQKYGGGSPPSRYAGGRGGGAGGRGGGAGGRTGGAGGAGGRTRAGGAAYPPRMSPEAIRDAESLRRDPGFTNEQAMAEREAARREEARRNVKYPPRLSPDPIESRNAQYPPRLSPEVHRQGPPNRARRGNAEADIQAARQVRSQSRQSDAQLEAQFRAEEESIRQMQKQYEYERRREVQAQSQSRGQAQGSGGYGGRQPMQHQQQQQQQQHHHRQQQGRGGGRGRPDQFQGSPNYPSRFDTSNNAPTRGGAGDRTGSYRGSPNYPPRFGSSSPAPGGEGNKYTRTLSRTSTRSPAPASRTDHYGIDAPFGRMGDVAAPVRPSRGRTGAHPSRVSHGNMLSHEEHAPGASPPRARPHVRHNPLAGDGERQDRGHASGRRRIGPPRGSAGNGPLGAYPGSGNEPNAQVYGAGGAYGSDVGTRQARGVRPGFRKQRKDLAPKIGHRY